MEYAKSEYNGCQRGTLGQIQIFKMAAKMAAVYVKALYLRIQESLQLDFSF